LNVDAYGIWLPVFECFIIKITVIGINTK
jgi:hypothetical protein